MQNEPLLSFSKQLWLSALLTKVMTGYRTHTLSLTALELESDDLDRSATTEAIIIHPFCFHQLTPVISMLFLFQTVDPKG